MKRPCPCCNGAGTIELTGVYAETLTLLAKQRREVHPADLARIAKCEGTTMCNRLAALERMGLAVSRQYGRKRLYRIKRSSDNTVST